MGSFAEFVFAEGRWSKESSATPRLGVMVHDSDIAAIEYTPTPDAATGVCFLGYEPRHYFGNEGENRPVDTDAEAQGLAVWARLVTGTEPEPDDIRSLLASPEGAEPEDVFVEDTLGRLFATLGLPEAEEHIWE